MHNLTAQDQLAKLLATEDVTVHHSVKAKTASFDLVSRVLTLPILQYTTKEVEDMMTGHEVGHALWTEMSEWQKAIDKEKIHQQILNIVEDARIEKKIKRKYPGIVKSFIKGYGTLLDKGFFGEDANNPTQLSLLDRINLHFKLGHTAAIPFNASEEWAVKAVAEAETFDDVKRVSKMLQIDHTETLYGQDHAWGIGDGESDGEGFTTSDEEESKKSDGKKEADDAGVENAPDAADFDPDKHGDLDDDEFSTEASFENHMEDLVDTKSDEYVYFDLPKANLKNIIVPYKQIASDLHEYIPTAIEKSGIHYNKFRRDSQKIINYMVKEFERRKAANQYRKVSIAKTGIIDVNKLHSYRYSEDIFLKNTIMPDGKNHGLVMLLDWSASMHHHLGNTIKQLLNLVWFCEKVNIPFEVYAFTNAYQQTHMHRILGDKEKDGDAIRREMLSIPKFSEDIGTVRLGGGHVDFNLLNFFSSRMSARDIARMAKALYAIGYGIDHRWEADYYRMENQLHEYSLSSTPLVEALIAMQSVIPLFQKTYKLHRTNFICLTDGEANTGWESVYSPAGHKGGRLDGYAVKGVFNDPLTRKVYHMDKLADYWARRYERQVVLLIRLLRDRYGVNTIGIFLDNQSKGRSVRRKVLEHYLGWFSTNKEAHAKVRAGIKKNGFATITNAGYNEYYIVPAGSTEIQDGSLHGVDENTSKSKLKTAFVKSQKNKFGSRILADRMLTLII